MSALPNVEVFAHFGLAVVGNVFTLDDDTYGILDYSPPTPIYDAGAPNYNVNAHPADLILDAGLPDDIIANLYDASLSGTGYGLANDATDIGGLCRGISINRGRNNIISGAVDAGHATIQFDNRNRDFDPTNLASPFLGQIVPGVQIDIVVDNIAVFVGRAQDWNFGYTVEGDSIANVVLQDALGVLGGQGLDDIVTIAQGSGERVSMILNRNEVSWTGGRAIDTGYATLQADVITWGTNVLNYLQLVAETEAGYLYASRDGVLTFKDRYTGFNPTTVALTFADNKSDIPFHAIAPTYTVRGNQIMVDRANGGQITATDQTSADTYGWKSVSYTGLLEADDQQASDLAAYLLSIYKDPVYRVTSVTVRLAGLTLLQRLRLLSLDISSLVGTLFTPNRVGSALSATSIVQGIDHTIDLEMHEITFHLDDAGMLEVFVLDDDTFGLLDGINAIGF